MTFDEIDARYRTAVLSGESDGWDDPENADDADDDDPGYRDADGETTHDEAGDQGPEDAA